MDTAHARVGAAERDLLRLIAEADRAEVWRDDGARDTAHWLSMRYGISAWKAHRWIAAAHALEGLPRLSVALERGDLGIDKVVELARFATAETEADLIRWAKGVSCAAVRRRGDLAARALERMAETVPAMPGEEDPVFASARRADALVALCSARIASDADPDRATVVVHAQLEGLANGTGGCELEGGPVIHPETARRLLCNARVQTLVEDAEGDVVAFGRISREPPQWMLRQVRHRDRECRFPGCGARRFTEAHHIRWWRHGGRTELDNLLLICSFHHRLVHELGWSVRRDADGSVGWLRPEGTRYRAGPSPGGGVEEPSLAAAAG